MRRVACEERANWQDVARETGFEFHTLEGRYPTSQLMPRVLFNTGDAFFNLKSFDSALVYYQRVIREYGSSPLVADAIGGVQYTYEAQGRPRQALADIDTILAKNPPQQP